MSSSEQRSNTAHISGYSFYGSLQKEHLNGASLHRIHVRYNLQNENNFTKIMYLNEKFKTMPIGDVWEEYLSRQGLNDDWWDKVEEFENKVISNRK